MESRREDDDGRDSRSDARGVGAAWDVRSDEEIIPDVLPGIRGVLHEVTRAAGRCRYQGVPASPDAAAQSGAVECGGLRGGNPVSVSRRAAQTGRRRRSAAAAGSQEAARGAESGRGRSNVGGGPVAQVPNDLDRRLRRGTADLGGPPAPCRGHRQQADAAPYPWREAGQGSFRPPESALAGGASRVLGGSEATRAASVSKRKVAATGQQ